MNLKHPVEQPALGDRRAAPADSAPNVGLCNRPVGKLPRLITSVRPMGGLRRPLWPRVSPQAKCRRHFRTLISPRRHHDMNPAEDGLPIPQRYWAILTLMVG